MFPAGGVPRRDEAIIGAYGELRRMHRLLPHEIAAIKMLALCLVADAVGRHLLQVNSWGLRYR
ncbi:MULTISPECIES: hypothetical protein [unclassified Streptomyces]|uniref:hypothetical protein n=1 Tax=unclassified Streptomyces TaxID=2593676 RepID=UPI0035DE67E7